MTTIRRTEGALRAIRRSPLASALRWATGLALTIAVVGVVVISLGTFTGLLSLQTVPTGSMEPTIAKGSAIVVDPIAVDDIAVDDVIVFAAPDTGRMTVHRVAAIESTDQGPVFTTKGDANDGPDPWRLTVEGDHLHQVRVAVPYLGRVLLAFAAPITRLALAGLGAAFVLGFGLRHVWGPRRDLQPATATWERALDRVAHALPHQHRAAPLPHDPAGAPDPLLALLADAEHLNDPGPGSGPDPAGSAPAPAATDGDGRRPTRHSRRPLVSAGSASVVVVTLAAGVAAWLPVRTADAAFTGTTATSTAVASASVVPKQGVTCAWNEANDIAMAWVDPDPTVGTQVLTADGPGGPTTVAASAAPGATSATVSLPGPLTDVRYVSTRAVQGAWTSTASPETPTNSCRNAVRLFVGGAATGFGGDGGPAVNARLDAPYQTAQAPDGRVFIADSGNDRIRVVSTGGVISTFAGSGNAGNCNYRGPVGNLRLSGPRGVAVDGAGNVYIADTGQDCIRMVAPDGSVSPVAGGGSTSSCSATTSAGNVSMSSPTALAIGPAGELIVADTGRGCVRRVSGGSVSRVAGGGNATGCGATTSTAVSLSEPSGIDVDAAGNVYIADTGHDCVRMVATSGQVTAVAGGGNRGQCTWSGSSDSVRLRNPIGVAVAADGTVYVADTDRRCVRQVGDGTVSPLAFTGGNGSSGDDGPAREARIRAAGSITVVADGDLLVSDTATNRSSSDIRRVELS